MGKARVILIVDDDVELRRLWRAALSLEGFETVEAGDGIEALHHLEQRSFDLVVLDLGLPRLGGLSVQQEIAAQAATRDTPVVVVTGSTMDLGHVDVPCVLRKPFLPHQLVDAVWACLQSGAHGVRP